MSASIYNSKVKQIFYHEGGHPSGEVGIEIEVEGRNLPLRFSSQSPCARWWRTVDDGSLRREGHTGKREGDQATEYVLRTPVARHEVSQALKALADKMLEQKSEIYDTYRTSVHVHLNVLEMSMKEVYTFVTIFTILEDILVAWCGPNRVGNRFCLKANDAEFMISEMRRAVRDDQYNILGRDNMRYAALNVAAVNKYGSLEFRSMRGTTDPAVIQEWVNVLLALKDSVMRFKDPGEVIRVFSSGGYQEFLGAIFGRAVPNFITNSPRLRERMVEGMRIAQELAFCTRWEDTPPIAVRNTQIDFNTTVETAAPPIPVGWREPIVVAEDTWLTRVAETLHAAPQRPVTMADLERAAVLRGLQRNQQVRDAAAGGGAPNRQARRAPLQELGGFRGNTPRGEQ